MLATNWPKNPSAEAEEAAIGVPTEVFGEEHGRATDIFAVHVRI